MKKKIISLLLISICGLSLVGCKLVVCEGDEVQASQTKEFEVLSSERICGESKITEITVIKNKNDGNKFIIARGSECISIIHYEQSQQQ